MRKLNMWKRLGIVLSVLWLVGVTGYCYNFTATQAVNTGIYWAHTCEQIRMNMNQAEDYNACWLAPNSKYNQGYKLMMGDHAFLGSLAVALIPLPFLWLIAWGIASTGRWVLRGRQVEA